MEGGEIFLPDPEIKILKSGAAATEEVFVHLLEQLMPEIPEALREDARAYIDGIKNVPPISHQELTYIPIQHFARHGDIKGDRKLQREIFLMLSALTTEPTLIASGERVSQSYTKSKLHAESIGRIKRYVELGAFPPGTQFPANVPPLDGYEEAVCDFVSKNSNVRTMGVDAEVGEVLQGLGGLTNTNLFASKNSAHTSKYFFGIEGRTRFSLNNTFHQAKPDEKIVFIQGFSHKPGVEEWCKRNSVQLTVEAPQSLTVKGL